MNHRRKTLYHSRSKPYDLRKRVLLKNFLKEQMVCVPRVITGAERHIVNDKLELQSVEKTENSGNDGNGSTVENDENRKPESWCVDTSSENSEKNEIQKSQTAPLYELKTLLISGENSDSIGNTGMQIEENCFKNISVEDPSDEKLTKKLKRKFSMRMPYSFSKRKAMRDGKKFHVENSISKMKKVHKNPEDNELNKKFKFGNLFSAETTGGKSPVLLEKIAKKSVKKRSESFISRLFKAKVSSTSSEISADRKSISDDEVFTDPKNATPKRSIAVQTESNMFQASVNQKDECEARVNRNDRCKTRVNKNEECDNNQLLREENRRLLKNLNYLIAVNQSNYWLRSSDKKNAIVKRPHPTKDEYVDRNKLSLRRSACCEESVCFMCQKNNSSMPKSDGTKILRSKSIQEHDKYYEKYNKCRRVKSFYESSIRMCNQSGVRHRSLVSERLDQGFADQLDMKRKPNTSQEIESAGIINKSFQMPDKLTPITNGKSPYYTRSVNA